MDWVKLCNPLILQMSSASQEFQFILKISGKLKNLGDHFIHCSVLPKIRLWGIFARKQKHDWFYVTKQVKIFNLVVLNISAETLPAWYFRIVSIVSDFIHSHLFSVLLCDKPNTFVFLNKECTVFLIVYTLNLICFYEKYLLLTADLRNKIWKKMPLTIKTNK